MALPVGVTSALAHIDAPVSFSGTPAKVYLEVVPNVRLNHIASGTPLANFIDVRTPGLGEPATVTLPHTDQTGFQDESGMPVVNWSYAATIRYELDGQLIHVPTKHFQILTGQTDIDLALIPVGEPAEIILGNVAFVSSVNGRSGAVTLSSTDLGDPIEIGSNVNLDSLTTTGDYIQSQNAEATLVLNYPQASAGKLRVDNNGTHVFHEYTVYKDGGNAVWTRARYLNVWSGWAQLASFTDPNADRIAFWDDSAGTFQPLSVSAPLTISGTTMSVSAASETVSGRVELATAAETATGTDVTRAVHPAGLKPLLDAKAPIASPTFTGAVGGITKSMVGLGNVDNTSDAAKPISTATQTALDLKNGLTGQSYRSRASADDPTLYPMGVSNFLAGSADGWSWSDGEGFKNVMTIRQTFGSGTGGTFQFAFPYLDNSRPPQFRAWDSDDTAWGPWFIMASRTYVDALIAGLTKASVGLGNVDNTSDANKPVSTAQQTALDLKANLTALATLQPISRSIRAVTVNTNVDANTDDIILVNSTTARTISLPDPANAVAGKLYTIKNINTATATVQSLGTSKTLDGAASQTLAQWAKAMYVTTGAQWYTV